MTRSSCWLDCYPADHDSTPFKGPQDQRVAVHTVHTVDLAGRCSCAAPGRRRPPVRGAGVPRVPRRPTFALHGRTSRRRTAAGRRQRPASALRAQAPRAGVLCRPPALGAWGPQWLQRWDVRTCDKIARHGAMAALGWARAAGCAACAWDGGTVCAPGPATRSCRVANLRSSPPWPAPGSIVAWGNVSVNLAFVPWQGRP